MLVTKKSREWRKYAEWYPCAIDDDYDGVHDGGFIRMKPGAPKWAVRDCENYLETKKIREDRLGG